MPFLTAFSIDTDKQHPFPFNIPAIRFAKQVALDPGVTIFVGDNGCGKSTLLETIALHLKIATYRGTYRFYRWLRSRPFAKAPSELILEAANSKRLLLPGGRFQ